MPRWNKVRELAEAVVARANAPYPQTRKEMEARYVEMAGAECALAVVMLGLLDGKYGLPRKARHAARTDRPRRGRR